MAKKNDQSPREALLVNGKWEVLLSSQQHKEETSKYVFQATSNADQKVYLTVAFEGKAPLEADRFKQASDKLKTFVSDMLKDINKIS